MFYKLNLLLFILFSSFVLTSSLQCYKCDTLLIIDDILTIDNVPSISSQCPLVTAVGCRVWFELLLTVNTTIISVEVDASSTTSNNSQEIITAEVFLSQRAKGIKPSLTHTVDYKCDLQDKCNDENSIKKLLHSIRIEDQFQQDLLPLIEPIPSFDPKTAQCLNMSNMTTGDCLQPLFESCQRCEIINNNREFCATCNSDTFDINSIQRIKTFVLNNRTQDVDSASLNCQLHSCNTIENIYRIHQTSQITFDSKEFT